MSFPAGWIVPDWPAPPGVHAVCSTRTGGVSTAPYDTLNLGDHVGADPHAVAANRVLFSRAVDARPVFMKQVHGTAGVVRLDRESEDGVEADGCWTDTPGVACTIMVADCLPVLLALQDGTRVGAAHAGWRGLAGGILEATLRAMGSEAPTVRAWLGPCIGPQAFEVGPEVKAAFEAHAPGAAAFFRAHTAGKWFADLPGLARRRLQALGITRIFGNDGSAGWCTFSNP